MPSFKPLINIYENILSESFLKEGPGNLEKDGLLTINTPPATYKLGKYTLVRNEPAIKMSYSQAASKKYISGATLKSLKELEDVGFVFSDAIFTSEVRTSTSPWVRGPATYLAGISTIILGKDPKGEDIAYVRKADSQAYAKVYFANRYGKVRDVFQNYIETPTPEQLMDIMVRESNATLIKNGDGTVDINGNLHVMPSVKVGKVGSYKVEHIPLKIRKITGDLNFNINNLKNFPDEVSGITNIDFNKETETPIDYSPLTNLKTKSLHMTRGYRLSDSLHNFTLDLSFLPPVHELFLNGIPLTTTNLKGIKLLQGPDSSFSLIDVPLNNLEGLPEEYEGNIRISNYNNNGVKSLKGMPKIVHGNVHISGPDSYNFFDLPEVITGNLKWFVEPFNEVQAKRAYIGTRVQGDITVTDRPLGFGSTTLNKKPYNKDWVNAQQQNISKHDVDITGF